MTEETAVEMFSYDDASEEKPRDSFISYFLLDSEVILTAIEFVSPKPQEDPTIVVIVRDCTGR
jgi:hypothetical protein